MSVRQPTPKKVSAPGADRIEISARVETFSNLPTQRRRRKELVPVIYRARLDISGGVSMHSEKACRSVATSLFSTVILINADVSTRLWRIRVPVL
jgi:hypothetical protein